MNISYNWLKQYFNTDLEPEKAAEQLTALGLEVGTVETVQTIKGGLKGLIVAEVVECIVHPNSDHLQITKINIGEGEPFQVVCGAPNCRLGLKTILATVGTKLYDKDKSFTIKKSKIRGEVSLGMLCGADEIGIGTSHDGIIELPADTLVGTTAKEYYQIEDDTLIEIDLTPNRSDATSHYGVARDLAAGVGLKATKPSIDNFKIDNTDYNLKVSVEDADLCPRYAGLTISGVKVKESPKWIKDKLSIIGIQSINNIVDATNYVLHELGQPLHAYDGDKIIGNEIKVQTVADKTKFTSLDDMERTLSDKDLMICNAENSMCIAGVFGGKDSGVSESTTKIFLESAYFNPISIRKSARRHNLNTDASFRFERGCDPNMVIFALKRVALIIQEIAGGEVSSEIIDLYPKPIENFKVELTYDKVNKLIGKEIGKEKIKSILRSLEIIIEKETEKELFLSIPPYRADVQRDIDVIEDILRVYGYNNILPGEDLKSSITYSQKINNNALQNRIAKQLTGVGFREILNNSLTKVSYYEKLSTYSIKKAVKIINPLGSDLSLMRQTLIFGGLENIAHNRNRRHNNLRFYEFGTSYHYDESKAGGEEVLAPYSEKGRLAMWLCGNHFEPSWTDTERALSFFDLKAQVINVLTRLGITQNKYNSKNGDTDLFSQSLRFETNGGKCLIELGIISKDLQKAFDIDSEIYFAEFDWDVVLKQVKRSKMNYQEIPKHHGVRRDLALLLDKKILFGDIKEVAFETERKLLKEVALFDVYEGEKLEEGKKSYAVSFKIQDENKTLNDKQIEKVMSKLIKAFSEKFDAKIR